MTTASTPTGACFAFAGDWYAARSRRRAETACLRTSPPTLPLAPVMRIITRPPHSGLQPKHYRSTPRVGSRHPIVPYTPDGAFTASGQRLQWAVPVPGGPGPRGQQVGGPRHPLSRSRDETLPRSHARDRWRVTEDAHADVAWPGAQWARHAEGPSRRAAHRGLCPDAAWSDLAGSAEGALRMGATSHG